MARTITSGLLCVPSYDEAAVTAVRRVLHTANLGAMILADRSVESRRYLVEETLRRWCDEDELDLILTIGGTMPAAGPASHEIVPEATMAVLERSMPGLCEAMRAYATEESALALLDRGVAGIRGRTLLVNLPAGAGAAALFLEAIVDLLAPVLAHVNGDPDAPALAEAVNAPQTDRAQKKRETQLVAAPPEDTESSEQRPRHSLDADEFAEFLRRRTSGE
jgi:molybdopterin biosynthesis enzyme MoaB